MIKNFILFGEDMTVENLNQLFNNPIERQWYPENDFKIPMKLELQDHISSFFSIIQVFSWRIEGNEDDQFIDAGILHHCRNNPSCLNTIFTRSMLNGVEYPKDLMGQKLELRYSISTMKQLASWSVFIIPKFNPPLTKYFESHYFENFESIRFMDQTLRPNQLSESCRDSELIDINFSLQMLKFQFVPKHTLREYYLEAYAYFDSEISLDSLGGQLFFGDESNKNIFSYLNSEFLGENLCENLHNSIMHIHLVASISSISSLNTNKVRGCIRARFIIPSYIFNCSIPTATTIPAIVQNWREGTIDYFDLVKTKVVKLLHSIYDNSILLADVDFINDLPDSDFFMSYFLSIKFKFSNQFKQLNKRAKSIMNGRRRIPILQFAITGHLENVAKKLLHDFKHDIKFQSDNSIFEGEIEEEYNETERIHVNVLNICNSEILFHQSVSSIFHLCEIFKIYFTDSLPPLAPNTARFFIAAYVD
ncbi:hypothetical protein HMI56_000751 [Coelomomyces lativittatus]|nr:hypothetical protein HMI56_000751 [Coelomomyces lativittatus]